MVTVPPSSRIQSNLCPQALSPSSGILRPIGTTTADVASHLAKREA